MADAVISATIQVALETAVSLATDRIGMLAGFKKDLASMTRSLTFINALLADAEERQQNQDRGVQEWLKSLEEVAYDADNVLDELNYESLRCKVESRNQHKRKVCCFFSFSNINLAFRWRMASKVRDIKLKLNEINQEARDLGLVERAVMTAALPAAADAGNKRNRQTDSVLVPIIGRADDESNIVKILLSPSEKVVSVLPIIGMGGLGKTTLAKSIYNNQQIDGQFEKKMWVCVSKKVPVVELFKLMLVQLMKGKVEVDDRNVIVEDIQNELGGKRYFLVLDDVWDDDQALWDDFFTTLKGLNPTNGSWCLVTTRLGSVAHSVSRVLRMMENEAYPLGKLPDYHCWSIVKEKVVGKEEEPDELKAIKERVIERCDGLPLAASVIGGLLSLKRKEEWRSILENRLLRFSGDEDRVVQILKLSFDNLPSPYIKKCFAYCSIFPKDTKMEGDMLIELWMAEGFLQADINSQMMMEEIGMNYLRILLQSSLFEETRDYWGTYYKMHDLVHDVTELMSKSTKVCNSGVAQKIDNGNQIRYLAIDSFGGGEDREKLSESLSTSLHTLFIKNGDLSGDMLMKLKNLYVLNLSCATTQELPVSIGNLIHLRYVNLECSAISILPDSLCKLYNLQTLTLSHSHVKDLPMGMCNLISLRHLHCYIDDDVEFQMPLEMGQLTCLRTLKFFNVGREKGRRIGVLGSLKNLKGKLEIRNLELVKDKEEAEEAKLSEKTNLFRLELLWARDREGDNYDDEDVLDGLRSHQNLEELAICRFMGNQFPRWLMDLPTALPKLACLEFNYSHRCRELLPLQNFTSLKELQIYGCNGLTNLPGDMLHSCASLQKLQVRWCNNLISFPLDLQQTPSLLELALCLCPKLKTSMTPKGFGFLTSLNSLEIGPFLDDDDHDHDHENSSIYNEFDWSGLISSSSSSSSALRELDLYGLPHMESLPHQIQYLTTLTSLALYGFGGIKALPDWLGNFTALEELRLHGFKELGHLPSEDAMRSLTKLKYLRISCSPLLKERCTPESSGSDSQWCKVSHIQDLEITDY